VGAEDVRHPGVVVDGKLVTTDLVEINPASASCSATRTTRTGPARRCSSQGPAGEPGGRPPPLETSTPSHAAEADFGGNYTWVMSPRWYDGKDHLALDTGGGRWRACGHGPGGPGGHRVREVDRPQRDHQPAQVGHRGP